MNRGLQISLLIVTFVISTGVGYYVSDMLFGETAEPSTPAVETPAVVEEPELSPIPEIIDVTTPEWVEGEKMYKFKVMAEVENGNELKYYLYTDEYYKFECDSNSDGVFYVMGSDSGTYYLKVANNEKRDPDNVARRVITDCDKRAPQPVQSNVKPLTESQVENSINNTTDGYVPGGWSAYFALIQKVNVLNNSSVSFSNFADVWQAKGSYGTINSVKVVKLYYNNNKIEQMDINVY